ncbi:MAG: VCBS repeat-containing protein [Hormoscilla sp. GUM202]|nr:VCBS repeat-containing protein [Hormoscilla sp. GUM202]
MRNPVFWKNRVWASGLLSFCPSGNWRLSPDGRSDILRQEKGGWDNDDSLTAQVLLSELSEDNDSFNRIFLPESLAVKGDLTNLYIGDFDGDGQSDVLRQEKGIWGNDDRTTAQILLSQGDGNFNPITLPEDFALKGDFTNLHIGDFNGDDRDDVLRQEKGSWDDDDQMTARVLLSQGDGNFTSITLPEGFNLKGDFTNLYIGDFNGDDRDDVLRQEKGSWDDDDIGTAHVLLSQGDGNFTRIPLPESFELKGDLTNLYVEDLNGDGKDEILVQKKYPRGERSRTLRILGSDDGENFTEYLLPSALQFNGDGRKLYIADYDGNGFNNDLLVQSFANEARLYSIDFQSILDASVDQSILNAGDYAALSALHTSTNGKHWKNKTGWDFDSETPPSVDAVNDWSGPEQEWLTVSEAIEEISHPEEKKPGPEQEWPTVSEAIEEISIDQDKERTPSFELTHLPESLANLGRTPKARYTSDIALTDSPWSTL